MGIAAQAASIADFRACLRVLVSTSIVEEGIDVPECDAVISFDHAITSRELQQRHGRARAPNSAYLSMLPRGNARAVEAVQLFIILPPPSFLENRRKPLSNKGRGRKRVKGICSHHWQKAKHKKTFCRS